MAEKASLVGLLLKISNVLKNNDLHYSRVNPLPISHCFVHRYQGCFYGGSTQSKISVNNPNENDETDDNDDNDDFDGIQGNELKACLSQIFTEMSE